MILDKYGHLYKHCESPKIEAWLLAPLKFTPNTVSFKCKMFALLLICFSPNVQTAFQDKCQL